MIDIHTHILPTLDDGSSCVEHSLNMVNECVKQGVTDVILTPHYRKPFIHRATSVQACFDQFKEIVEQQNIPINLYLGQELYVNANIKNLLRSKKVFTLNHTKYILLEFDYNEEQEIAEIVYELKHAGYMPIVAHAERYTYVDLEIAKEIKDSGGLIQINAQAIAGVTDRRKKKIAKQLLKNGLVDFVASDLHNRRTNFMKKAYDFVKKKYGEQTAERLFVLNAQEIIKG